MVGLIIFLLLGLCACYCLIKIKTEIQNEDVKFNEIHLFLLCFPFSPIFIIAFLQHKLEDVVLFRKSKKPNIFN